MNNTLAFAFAAGMLSTVNPCGFALLPAFLGYYVGQDSASEAVRRPLTARLVQGLVAGLALSAGFAAVFTVSGLLVAAGLRSLVGAVPWAAVLIGGLLVAVGVALIAGRQVGIRLRRGAMTVQRGGVRGMATFGAAYAIASLSCTLALLLAVVAQAVATADLMGILAVFAAYGLGATTLLVLLAISTAVASGVLAATVRRMLPWVSRISGAALALSGAYLIAYWLPVLLGGAAQGGGVGSVGSLASGAANRWLSERVGLVVVVAVVVVTTIVVASLVARSRSRSRARAGAGEDDSANATDCCSLEDPKLPEQHARSGR